MTKLERFITPVTCPECASNGSATWEESERADLETTIKNVSNGFRIGPDGKLYCADCGVKAIMGKTLSRSEMKRSIGIERAGSYFPAGTTSPKRLR